MCSVDQRYTELHNNHISWKQKAWSNMTAQHSNTSCIGEGYLNSSCRYREKHTLFQAQFIWLKPQSLQENNNCDHIHLKQGYK